MVVVMLENFCKTFHKHLSAVMLQAAVMSCYEMRCAIQHCWLSHAIITCICMYVSTYICVYQKFVWYTSRL